MVQAFEKLSVRSQRNLLGIHRSGFYYVPSKESEENQTIMRLLDERYLAKPTHGVLQMLDYFRDEQGLQVNHKRIRRLLRLMGLMAIYPKKNLSKLGHAIYIHPYLLRSYTTWRICRHTVISCQVTHRI